MLESELVWFTLDSEVVLGDRGLTSQSFSSDRVAPILLSSSMPKESTQSKVAAKAEARKEVPSLSWCGGSAFRKST